MLSFSTILEIAWVCSSSKCGKGLGTILSQYFHKRTEEKGMNSEKRFETRQSVRTDVT